MRSFIRNILDKAGLVGLAQKLFTGWLQFKTSLELKLLLPVLSQSSFFRRIYFAFISGSFTAEMRQYITGRYFYLKRSSGKVSNASLLRRNIHRLEKGLMAENRKSVFGLDYIRQTVDQFEASVSENSSLLLNDWAFDILSEYFNVVEPTPVVNEAATSFSKVAYSKIHSEISRLPYQKGRLNEKAFSQFSELATTRKSVRTFVPGSVPPRQKVEEAVRLAATAPSSCNRQPFKFYVFENRDKVVNIGKLAGGARTFAEGIPALALVIGSTNVSPSPGDRHLMYIDGSLAAMNFMLSLESMGISSCPINWPDNKKPERALRKMVALEPYERPVMLIAMGQAAEDSLVACSVRKEVSELLKFNPE